MTTQNYLMVQETVVTNIVLWDGNTQSWQPPENATMLVYSTTPTKIWGYNEDETDFILVSSVGDASVGFTWDGSFATTNEPKPDLPEPQPIAIGNIETL